MFGKSDEEKRQEEIEQQQEEQRKQEAKREKYSHPFIVETLTPEDWDEEIKEDIAEKVRNGYEPISISTASPRYDDDYVMILYKKVSS